MKWKILFTPSLFTFQINYVISVQPELFIIMVLFYFILLTGLHHRVSGLSADLEGLVQVHLVYRHGDRTPISPYPNDPYKNYPW